MLTYARGANAMTKFQFLHPGENLLDMEEWLLVSGTPASSVGAEDDSLGISRVESPLAAGSAQGNDA